MCARPQTLKLKADYLMWWVQPHIPAILGHSASATRLCATASIPKTISGALSGNRIGHPASVVERKRRFVHCLR